MLDSISLELLSFTKLPSIHIYTVNCFTSLFISILLYIGKLPVLLTIPLATSLVPSNTWYFNTPLVNKILLVVVSVFKYNVPVPLVIVQVSFRFTLSTEDNPSL